MSKSTERRTVLKRLLQGGVILAVPVVARAQRLYEDFVFAVANDRAAQVRELLQRGVDPNTTDKGGDPALLVAARAGYQDTLCVLLAGRATVDRANAYGDTPLKVAALNGHLEIVRMLRERGAQID